MIVILIHIHKYIGRYREIFLFIFAHSIPSWEGPLEKGMATPSGILAWEISWTEDPGGP